MNDDGTDPSVYAFRDRLPVLKRRGCNVAVTGEVREEVSHRITQKLLGATDVPRTRLLALTDQDRADVPDLLPDGVSVTDGSVYTVDHQCGTRAAASSSANQEFHRHDLDDLQRTVCNAISLAQDAESGFDPAQLRVSVFTLSYLVGQHELDAVEQFVSAVGERVRSVSGMGHYHLPLPDDSETVQRLAPLFDARIELREKQGAPEQRWHFPELDAPTSWVGI
jgi:hypothetical protein